MGTNTKQPLVREISLRPLGWENSPESQRYPLSLIGHIMPKVYVLVAEVFALPADADSEAIVRNMTAGLEFTLSQFPVLTGTLGMDASNGRMFVAKNRDSAMRLFVKHMLKEEEFPSYNELEERDFPASVMAGEKLLPASVTAKQLHSPLGDNNEHGIPIATVQLSFIRGGLIVGLAIHHAVSDGPGCDGFLTTWAESSAAAANGRPFIPTSKQFSIHGSPLDVGVPSEDKLKELAGKFPVVKDAGGPMAPPPPGFKMPALVSQMWHFPKSKTEALKAQVTCETTDGWISTYDAIMALLWSSITRAKLPLLQPDLESDVTLVHAVDTRKMWTPPLPPRFLGVGAVAARCKPLPIREVVSQDGLARLAANVRGSINAVSPEHLVGMMQWIAGHEDQRWLEINVDAFLGMDLGASSWQSMSAYDKHDFGFGLPKALRWPNPVFEGFVFLYPSRAAMKNPAADEGVEVCVCLEQSCQERLMKDTVLLGYAQPRGV